MIIRGLQNYIAFASLSSAAKKLAEATTTKGVSVSPRPLASLVGFTYYNIFVGCIFLFVIS
jgi:hypothetical protein